MLGCALHAAASSSSFVPPPASAVAARPSPRAAAARLQEPPFPLPYSVPPLQKPYSDYVWDDSYPGTLKPGTLKENIDLDEAFEMWEGRENANMMELPQDELWQVPMPPPEDILSWLNRIGLLQETPDEDEESLADSSLLDEEFDLDDEDSDSKAPLQDSVIESSQEQGATMSDFM